MVEHTDLMSEKHVQSGTEGLARPLAKYFAAQLPNAENLQIANIDMPPADSGFSAENFFVDLQWFEDSAPQAARYVVRRQAKKAMFARKSFSQERRIQDVLSCKTDLPVPKIIAYEDDESVLGGRFYVMECIPGKTPPAVSPHELGMLAEMSERARRKLWFSGLTAMGRLHRLDPFELGLDFVSDPAEDGSQLTSLLDYWEQHYLDSCVTSCGGKPLPLMVEAMAWLRANAPEEKDVRLQWGDSRNGNMLFDDEQNCVGIVDWELASLGNPLQDLAYWTYSDDHFIHIAENGALPGWPTLDETIAAYEEASGLTVDRKLFQYYRLLAAYWIVCTLSQMIAIKKEVGQFPAEMEITEESFTPVSFYRAEFEAVKASW